MARLALTAVLVLTALAFILPSVQSSNQSQMEERIAALEERVYVLEQLAVVPRDLPVWEGAGDPTIITTSYDVTDIVPSNPAESLDLVCTIEPTMLEGAGVQDRLNTLRCARYVRFGPHSFEN
jgi:hypothetical protein